MPLIDVSIFNLIMHEARVWAARTRGRAGQNFGTGAGPEHTQARAALAAINLNLMAGQSDLEVATALGRPLLDAQAQATWETYFLLTWASFFQALNSHIARHLPGGATNIEAWLTHLNQGANPQALQGELWREMHMALTGGTTPAVWNLYAERRVSTTFPHGLGRRVLGSGGAFTDGVAINSAHFAGGRPWIRWDSITGGPHTITVTGNCYNFATRTVQTGVTWVHSVPNGTGNAALTGGTAPAGAYILDVTNISPTATGGGNVMVEAAHAPTGSPLSPEMHP